MSPGSPATMRAMVLHQPHTPLQLERLRHDHAHPAHGLGEEPAAHRDRGGFDVAGIV